MVITGVRLQPDGMPIIFFLSPVSLLNTVLYIPPANLLFLPEFQLR